MIIRLNQIIVHFYYVDTKMSYIFYWILVYCCGITCEQKKIISISI